MLSHKNIVRMFYIVCENVDDRSRSQPPLGYAMELMARSAQDNVNLSLERLLNLFEQIASALSFSHQHGVVHFDIKPENILLNDDCSTAKLCDFGSAHKLNSAAAAVTISDMTGQQRGTQLFMAPEVWDKEVNYSEKAHLCDIYSFGKTMWKLLHPKEKMYPQSQCPVTAPVPAALKKLIDACTMHNPAARPQSMSEVLNQLHDISKGSKDASVSCFISRNADTY
jgi:serine/threonine protein kinase